MNSVSSFVFVVAAAAAVVAAAVAVVVVTAFGAHCSSGMISVCKIGSGVWR